MTSVNSLELCNQVHTWLEEEKDGCEIQALLDLVEKRWVTILEFQEYPDHLRIKHLGGPFSDDEIELVCEVEALRAVRRRKDVVSALAETFGEAESA